MKKALYLSVFFSLLLSFNSYSQDNQELGGSDSYQENIQQIPDQTDSEIITTNKKNGKNLNSRKKHNRLGKSPFEKGMKQKKNRNNLNEKNFNGKDTNPFKNNRQSVKRNLMETPVWLMILGGIALVVGLILMFISITGVLALIGAILFILGGIALTIGFWWFIIDLIVNG